MTETDPLAVAETYLREEVAPRAADIDLDPDALGEALNGLCRRNLMALKRPAAFGGPAIDEAGFRQFQESVARYSGTLAFLQTQHQSAVSLIAKGDNERLKHETLPYMADGRRLIGIGFSQLRRSGPPILTATPVEGGYRLDGLVPWVTRPSGHRELDNAAVAIVRLASPFDPFPPAMRERYPVLRFAYEWQFLEGRLGGSSVLSPTP